MHEQMMNLHKESQKEQSEEPLRQYWFSVAAATWQIQFSGCSCSHFYTLSHRFLQLQSDENPISLFWNRLSSNIFSSNIKKVKMRQRTISRFCFLSVWTPWACHLTLLTISACKRGGKGMRMSTPCWSFNVIPSTRNVRASLYS